jgi:hypothetical protein
MKWIDKGLLQLFFASSEQIAKTVIGHTRTRLQILDLKSLSIANR